MYEGPLPEEINERRLLFEEFLEGHVQPPIEGQKKEAIEKVFFFNDQQFNEVCEDLKEEILRRKENGQHEFVPKYSLKRNTIREQISLLEEEELKSLVEDTYLVLKHKNATGPEDELACLNVLVQGLEEIIGKNSGNYKGTAKNLDSPSAVIISIEKLKQELEVETESEKKIEILLNIIDKHVSDLSILELLDMIRSNLNTIKTQKHQMESELYSLKNEVNDLYLERDLATETTDYEDTMETIVERISDHFQEIEHEVKTKGIAGVQKHLDLLNEERAKILQITQNKALEDVGELAQIKTEKDLLSRITAYYTAILTELSS
ncbi:hypothetical protein NEMIN01_1403 [Nematocida minor]|uniref:uncharacterized protein n=1 Tax=Nematocida minor TaxID=1912983 RepID=UPI00221E39EC|nr:uncharacterized protein NEMIN01_1403 [Nematocida minor]KAI5191195.1 hypothetical protein NEMIN01_1403 [Nematocida minor]